MKYALVNPNWTFTASTYFGCREPHLPLEYGYAKALLEQAGHEVIIVDGQLERLSEPAIKQQVANFAPDFTVITTAPSYLFWRCPPPELRVPQATGLNLRDVGGTMVAIGPHGSTTPQVTLRKLGVDLVILGEAEEILPQLAGDWESVPAICYRQAGKIQVQGSPHTSNMQTLPALHWKPGTLQNHQHHHHRFDATPIGLGAEMETSRGCPYHCSFCAKENFRDRYRLRPLAVVLEELDGLIAQGVEYIYLIDEIFLPKRSLLAALTERQIKFGIQTRIDLWTPELLELLGRAGCVSIEAGIESITPEGRQLLNKHCQLSTSALSELLIYAKQHVAFVQANLLDGKVDDLEAIANWRQHLQQHGVWANQPVPLFPYPGSPAYTQKWGFPDDQAWERANAYYLEVYAEYSDIQESQPLPLTQLELSSVHGS